MQQQQPLIVVWQSLVVPAYRSFFVHLLTHLSPTTRVALCAPQFGIEMSQQKVECVKFNKPFDGSQKNAIAFILPVRIFHTQIILFKGLFSTFKKFSSLKNAENHDIETSEKPLLLCIAEPYSVTALYIWLVATLCWGKNFTFVTWTCQNITKKFPFYLNLIQQFLFLKSEAILSTGLEQTKVLREQGYKGNCIQFPLWFDSETFCLKTNPPKIWQETGNQSRKMTLTFCGSFFIEKGILFLLDTLLQKGESLKNELNIAVVGKGPLEDQVLQKIEQLQINGWQAKYLGTATTLELVNIYNNTHILAVPSQTVTHWKEQFGRVIVEAQACGAVVIGSDSGEIPQVIGNKTFVFEEQNAEDLFAKIQAAISESRKPGIREKMRHLAVSRYSSEILALNFARNLKEQLGQQ